MFMRFSSNRRINATSELSTRYQCVVFQGTLILRPFKNWLTAKEADKKTRPDLPAN
jgi:hypothetical protein